MSDRGYDTVHLDDLERIELVEMNGCEWRPIRRRFGVQSFGVNAYTASKPGDWIVEEHTEARLQHQEVYFVVRGRARFELNDEELDAPAGTLVFIEDPTVKRVAFAEEENTTVFAIGAKPGEPFTPSAWEWWFEAYAKSPQEGVEIMKDGIEQLGEQAGLYYHLACMESRAGRKDDAREHLERAIELRPHLREQARDDPDLEGVLP